MKWAIIVPTRKKKNHCFRDLNKKSSFFVDKVDFFLAQLLRKRADKILTLGIYPLSQERMKLDKNLKSELIFYFLSLLMRYGALK